MGPWYTKVGFTVLNAFTKLDGTCLPRAFFNIVEGGSRRTICELMSNVRRVIDNVDVNLRVPWHRRYRQGDIGLGNRLAPIYAPGSHPIVVLGV